MGVLSTLRRMWRGHDEKLAERTYDDLHEPEPGGMPVPHIPPPYAPAGSPTLYGPTQERILDDAIREENTLEHEEPTAEEAASNEYVPEHEEP